MILVHKRLPGGAEARVTMSFVNIGAAIAKDRTTDLAELQFLARNTDPGLLAVEVTDPRMARCISAATNNTVREVLSYSAPILWTGDDALFILGNAWDIFTIAHKRYLDGKN